MHYKMLAKRGVLDSEIGEGEKKAANTARLKWHMAENTQLFGMTSKIRQPTEKYHRQHAGIFITSANHQVYASSVKVLFKGQ